MTSDDLDSALGLAPPLNSAHRAVAWARDQEVLGDQHLIEVLRTQSARYARAMAVAAMAESRIERLAEVLEETEYYRSAAEAELEDLQNNQYADFQLVTRGDPDGIPKDASVVFGVGGQRFYQRASFGWYWIGIDDNRTTAHEDPALDDGPFICFKESTPIDRLLERVSEMNEVRQLLTKASRGQYGNPSAHTSNLAIVKETIANLEVEVNKQRMFAAHLEQKLYEERKHVSEVCELFDVPTLLDLLSMKKAEAAAAKAVEEQGESVSGTVHELVRAAERMILEAADVQENGDDPLYESKRLRAAAKVLLKATEVSTDG